MWTAGQRIPVPPKLIVRSARATPERAGSDVSKRTAGSTFFVKKSQGYEVPRATKNSGERTLTPISSLGLDLGWEVMIYMHTCFMFAFTSLFCTLPNPVYTHPNAMCTLLLYLYTPGCCLHNLYCCAHPLFWWICPLLYCWLVSARSSPFWSFDLSPVFSCARSWGSCPSDPQRNFSDPTVGFSDWASSISSRSSSCARWLHAW